jgi:hypothetical protein
MKRWLKYAIVIFDVAFAVSTILAVPAISLEMSVYYPKGACHTPSVCGYGPGYTRFVVVGSVSFYLTGIGGVFWPAMGRYQFVSWPPANRT